MKSLNLKLLGLIGVVVIVGLVFVGSGCGDKDTTNETSTTTTTTAMPTPTTTPKSTATTTPTSTETTPTVKAGWTLYENTQIGFSLQYPDAWYLSELSVRGTPDSPLTILAITTDPDIPGFQEGTLGDDDKARVYVNHDENNEGLSLGEKMAQHIQPDFADNPPENIESTYLTIDGLEAHRFIYRPGNKWGSPGVYTTIQLADGSFLSLDGIVTDESHFDTFIDQLTEIEDSFRTL